MSFWVAIKKSINSDLSMPLDIFMRERTGLKGVQRGVVSTAGNVTISAVDMAKAFTISVSKGSAGSVGATGAISLNPHTLSGTYSSQNGYRVAASGAPASAGAGNDYGVTTTNVPAQSGTLTAGATNLTVREYSARLISPTQIYCDGPCEWQVIEHH